MITNKKQLLFYLEQDRKALNIGLETFKSKIVRFLSPNHIWQFQKTLRKLEYYTNIKKNAISNLRYLYLKYRFKKLSLKLGFSIPPNVFGPGLAIVHYGTIVVNGNSKVGANCRMHACVNIGASGGSKLAPQLGDNVYIAPGAKIYGNIRIAHNCAISANAVVNKSFEDEGSLIAGNPAKKIKMIDIRRIIKHI